MSALQSKIYKLSLDNFRSHESFEYSTKSNIIVITGLNGAGKTNLLEAISLFSPGKGLRGAQLQEIDCHYTGSAWSVSASVSTEMGVLDISTSHIKSNSKRQIKVSGDNVSNQAELLKLLSVSWLTPVMDQVFISGNSAKRKLLDKIVSEFDPEHISRLHKYEYFVRERMQLLLAGRSDKDWISITESSIAQNAVAIATSRVQTLEMLQSIINELDYGLSEVLIKIDGQLESMVNEVSSLNLEKAFESTLRENRDADRITKRTNAGIHRSNLLVYKKDKNASADLCSTGEQKYLLLSIFVAEIMAYIKWKNRIPILLLDDIMAHLDENRRGILCQIIKDVGAQAWLTGTDASFFKMIERDAEFLSIVAPERHKIKAATD